MTDNLASRESCAIAIVSKKIISFFLFKNRKGESQSFFFLSANKIVLIIDTGYND